MVLLYYILFAAMPFWHVTIFSHTNPLEIAVLINLSLLPFTLSKRDLALHRLDGLVFIYLLWELVSVGVGSYSFYESARVYRYMVLVPVLTYLCIRFSGITPQVFRRGFLLLVFGVFIKAVLVLLFYFTYKVRPVGEFWRSVFHSQFVGEMISMSFWCCFVACGLIFLRKQFKKNFLTGILFYGFLSVILAALYVTSTRAAIFTFIVVMPILLLSGQQSKLHRCLVLTVYLTVVAMFVSVWLVPNKSVSLHSLERDQSVSTGRVVNLDLALKDLHGRLLFWRVIVNKSLEKPLFGVGKAGYEIGKSARTSFSLGSSHNALISAFYTSGIFGFILLLSLYFAGFETVLKAMRQGFFMKEENIVFFSLIVLFLISITNDLTSGRANILLIILALIVRMYDWEILRANDEMV